MNVNKNNVLIRHIYIVQAVSNDKWVYLYRVCWLINPLVTEDFDDYFLAVFVHDLHFRFSSIFEVSALELLEIIGNNV